MKVKNMKNIIMKTLRSHKISTIALSLSVIVLSLGISPSYAGHNIRIVGSSTVYPFTTVVAEAFGRNTSFKTPIVESTGTGGGMKIFCSSKSKGSVDFTNASRKIKKKEFDKCEANGISVTEFPVGIDGIVLANSNTKSVMSITVPQLYLALAKMVKIDGKMVKNPYKKWSDIHGSLPNLKIAIMGPPPSSGTRDALVSLIMKVGAESFGIKEKKYYKVLREDSAFIELGENDNLIVRKLAANPNSFGIFGYSFLDENRDTLNASKINGVEANYDNIASFKYPVARYLYLYINRENVKKTAGMKEFIMEYTSASTLDEDGYLADRGLIVMPMDIRNKIISDVRSLKKLAM